MTSDPPKPWVRTHVVLQRDIHARLELLFWDPVRQAARYGKRSQLINQLLRRWLDQLPPDAGAVADAVESIGDAPDGTV